MAKYSQHIVRPVCDEETLDQYIASYNLLKYHAAVCCCCCCCDIDMMTACVHCLFVIIRMLCHLISFISSFISGY